MIRIAVVEDEELYAEQLQNYISKYAEERKKQIKVTWFQDGEDIVSGYKGEYDIILLDIQMRFMDGMTAAEKIRELDSEVVLMFITNMIQYAVRGYEVDAMDYVVKPVEDRVKKLNVAEILYIESVGHNVIYRMESGKYLSRTALKELEATMKSYGFFRCGKGFLVNKKMKQLFTKRGKLFLVSAEEPTCFAKITKNIQRNRDKLLENDMKYCSEKKNHV